ncbi:MAG: orotidine-5'-phosphate decarboxylase [Oscillospiraceae bacterium]|jgi:orotidine-5'-phosphate decarboxylase|nr:orotidine-5'-phosphate decarboxylase [Oscillospiraceae bacterium]
MGIDALIERIRDKRNPTVAGLDPRLEHLPPWLLAEEIAASGETLAAAANAVRRFNTALLDALADVVPAVKLQSACYEALGPEGMAVLRDSIAYARALGYYVIADAKRGDIGSTAECYSAAFLGRVRVGQTDIAPFDADAVTVNPYQGSDSIKPFLEDMKTYDRAIFVLGRTSNRSSSELQMLCVPDRPLYRAVADLTDRWGMPFVGKYGYTSVGLVVGATQPSEIRELREHFPQLFFLVPGYGAQGGTAWDVSRAFDRMGRGAIVNSSRAILCAWQKKGAPENFAEAARAEALRMKEELGKCIQCM